MKVLLKLDKKVIRQKWWWSRRTLGSLHPTDTTGLLPNHPKYPRNQPEDWQNKLHN